MAEKKKKDKDRGKYSLTSMQEVSYQREFKMADRAGGYHDKKTRLQKEKRKRPVLRRMAWSAPTEIKETRRA